MAQAFYWSISFLNCRLHWWISLSIKTICHLSWTTEKTVGFIWISVETMCISLHGKEARDIRSCYDHNPAFNLCKKEKRSDPFEEISMYRNTDKSKTGMHILYHIKIDIMSWEYLSCLWMHFLKTRRFVCELPLTFWLSYLSHAVFIVFSVPLLQFAESVLCYCICATCQSANSSLNQNLLK